MKHVNLVKKGTIVTVHHILGQTAQNVTKRINQEGKLEFTCDAYVIGDIYKDGFFNLWQAREVIPDKKLGNNTVQWTELKKDLKKAKVKTVKIPDGSIPIHYEDEIVIPEDGTNYYIIKLKDAEKYRNNSDEKDTEEKEDAEQKWSASKILLQFLNFPELKGEFKKITLVADDESERSIIYAQKITDLIWGNGANEPRVVCECPEETGIEYLSGFTAGKLDPKKHHRIKKFYDADPKRDSAYLMPNPTFANKTADGDWKNFFENADEERLALITKAKKIIIEAYEFDDTLVKERLVYLRDNKKVVKEDLCNWPFYKKKLTGKLEWKARRK